jgi:hypothetical protein
LTSLVAGMLFVEVPDANPWLGEPVPPSMRTPNKDSPSVTIQSPENTTYYQNEVLLDFTVTKPESWITTNVSCYITDITYQLDGHVIVLFDWLDPTGNHTLPSPKQFSVAIENLTEGQHTLQINVSAYSRYWDSPVFTFFYEDYPLDVYNTVNYAIAKEPSPTPTISSSNSPTQQPTIVPNPTLDNIQAVNVTSIIIIFGLVALSVVLGLLVYFKKVRK